MIQAECEDWDNWKKVYDDFDQIREGLKGYFYRTRS